MSTRTWFRIQSVADEPSAAEILIDGIIGSWGEEFFGDAVVTAHSFIEQLEQLPDTVTLLRVRVHSPGGSPFAGVAIANALRDQRTTKGRKVDVYIDGLAASAASIVIMAGDTIRMADNALVMIHRPYGGMIGNAEEADAFADSLRAIEGAIIATYRWRSSLSEDTLAQMMAEESWLDADAAIEAGFATEKISGVIPLKTKASVKALARLRVPEALHARVAAFFEQPAGPAPSVAAAAALDVVKACHAAGLPELSNELLAAGSTLEQVNARISTETSSRRAEAQRKDNISALCNGFSYPKALADALITGGVNLEAAKKLSLVVDAMVDAARGNIDAFLSPDDGVRPQHTGPERLDRAEIFKARTAASAAAAR